MSDQINYGYDVQKLYLEMFLADTESFVRCQSIFDHTLFDKRLKNAAKLIYDYVEQYNAIPTYDIINAQTTANLEPIESLKQEHFDWLLDSFEQFTRHLTLEKAIGESVDLLDNGEYGAVEIKVKEAVQISLQKDLGTDYFANPLERLAKIKSSNGQMPTGWVELDNILYGGFNRGELEIFCATSGGGKSLFLANLAVNYVQAGLNAMYVTLELSEELVCMRIDAMMTNTASRDVFKKSEQISNEVLIKKHKCGSLQVKYMPSGKTTNDIRGYMKEYEIKTGKKIDVLLVDYLDLLMPNGKKISAENLFIKDKFVSEELRNLASEKNVVLISCAQLNRGGVDEVEFNHSHISGGISKIQTADNVFGIFTTKAMRDRGQYQLQMLKTRNSGGVGSKIDLGFDIDTLRISNFSDADATNSLKKPSMLDVLQRRPVVTDEDMPVKATVGSSKLREMLNSLKMDD
jgi:replicative DNA helicase